MDDLAESFEYMYFINYSFSETSEILNFIEKNVPDIIIFENAERMSSFFTMLDEITDIIKTKWLVIIVLFFSSIFYKNSVKCL